MDNRSKCRTGYVALIGRPNAGKSTLMNTILDQKIAIISDKPQTTRNSILGIKTLEKGQIIFIDNPGIHKPLHRLNRRMMNFVQSSLETADLICLLIDGTLEFGHGDQYVIEMLEKISRPKFLVINKVDIIRKDKILTIIDSYNRRHEFSEIFPVSALTGTNVKALEKTILQYLPEADRLYSEDDITDQTMRFHISEIIREKLLGHVEKELPFVTAVLVEKIEDRKPRDEAAIKIGKYIKASIFVEKDNHRIIVIGRRGSRIKSIGMEARREIQKILEAGVYLDLQVKVKERWRDSANVLELIEGQ